MIKGYLTPDCLIIYNSEVRMYKSYRFKVYDDHAESRFNLRVGDPKLINDPQNRWKVIVWKDDKYFICFTLKGTVIFIIDENNRIATVLSNMNGASLYDKTDGAFRSRYKFKQGMDPAWRKASTPYEPEDTVYDISDDIPDDYSSERLSKRDKEFFEMLDRIEERGRKKYLLSQRREEKRELKEYSMLLIQEQRRIQQMHRLSAQRFERSRSMKDEMKYGVKSAMSRKIASSRYKDWR